MKPVKMLVIDDSLTVRKLVELSFKAKGATLEFASTGHDGVTRATQAPPDLILLDFILPDMRGTEVCQRLSLDARTASVPVILMSAKGENVRDHFKAFASVVDYVGKPFTAPEIVGRIEAVLANRPAAAPRAEEAPAPPPKASAFSFQQKEAAAKALYAQLKPRLAQIPEWAAQQGQSPAAQYYAKKILTPELMEKLLEALVPVFKGVLGGGALSGAPGPKLEGELTVFSPLALLEAVAGSGRTGEFTLDAGEVRTVTFWRQGELILATSTDPQQSAAEGGVDLSGVPAAVQERASAEQKASGKPLQVTLAEAGQLPACDLAAVLHRVGQRVLQRALSEPTLRYGWAERAALPPYADAYGRRISVLQLSLLALRAGAALNEAEQRALSRDWVFERAPDFSRKLRQLELDASERRVLSLVDGRSLVQQLLDRSGLDAKQAIQALHRLSRIELLRRREAAPARPRPVLVLDPDVEGFHRPLAKLLKNRPLPLEVIGLDPEKDVFAAILRERPSLVILNASASGPEAQRVARAISTRSELSDLSLVAVLDAQEPARIEELSAAGFDAVLVKPIHYPDLERLIAA